MGAEEPLNSEVHESGGGTTGRGDYLDAQIQSTSKVVLTLPASSRDVCARISALSEATKQCVCLSPAIVSLQKQAQTAMSSGVYKTIAAAAKTASKVSPATFNTLMKMSETTMCHPDIYRTLNGPQTCFQLLIKGAYQRARMADASDTNLPRFVEAAKVIRESWIPLVTRRNYINLLVKTNWPLFLVHDDSMTASINALVTKDDIDEVEKAVKRIAFKALDHSWLDSVRRRWEGHSELSLAEREMLSRALEYHECGRYDACVSILMCMLEGLIEQYGFCITPSSGSLDVKTFSWEAEKHNIRREKVVSNGDLTKLHYSKDILIALLIQADKGYYVWHSACSYVIGTVLTNRDDFEVLAAKNPLRNKICHGAQTNYGTKTHSLKSILTIDIVIRLGCAASANVRRTNAPSEES